jgi:hypothetical protein
MKISFDQTSDYSFRELHRFLKKAEHVPDYIQEAELKDLSGLPKEAFADVYNKAFPKNTKESTYLSYVHFINKKAALEERYNKTYTAEVENRLQKAAELFEITEDLKNYKESLLKKEAADYTEKVVFERDGMQLFPFKTASDLKLASEQYIQNYRKIPFQWRQEICENFVKHATDLGVDELPDLVCKYAGMFYAHPEHVKTELIRRSKHNPNPEFKTAYVALSEQVDGLDDINDFMKIASACHDMEKMAGCYDNYNKYSVLGDPVDQIFSMSVEKVAEVLDVVKLGENYYKMQDLQKVSTDIYKQAFGADIDPQDSNELRDVLPTMPNSDLPLFFELSGINHI